LEYNSVFLQLHRENKRGDTIILGMETSFTHTLNKVTNPSSKPRRSHFKSFLDHTQTHLQDGTNSRPSVLIEVKIIIKFTSIEFNVLEVPFKHVVEFSILTSFDRPDGFVAVEFRS